MEASNIVKRASLSVSSDFLFSGSSTFGARVSIGSFSWSLSIACAPEFWWESNVFGW